MIVNQTKHMYWRMMLTAVILLAFSSTSPTAMEPQTIGSGSSASHHVLGVDHSGAQVKRRLRPNAEMSENIDGDTEERLFSPAEALEELIKSMSMTVRSKNLVNKIDVNPKNLLEDIDHVQILREKDGEAEVIKMIKFGKPRDSHKAIAERLENGLLMNWFLEDRHVDIIDWLAADCKTVGELLSKPFIAALNKDPYRQNYLIQVMSSVLRTPKDDIRVALGLPKAKGVDYMQPIGIESTKRQREAWLHAGYDSGKVYELLQLDKEGVNALKSEWWDTWVLYLVDLENKKHPNQEQQRDLLTLIISALIENKGEGFTRNLIAASSNVKETKDFANLLTNELKLTLTLGNNF